MPLYEYRCLSCGERTEVLQHLGDAPLKQCPHCGGAVEKVLSAPALQFKGTGWYVTDYSHKNSAGSSTSSSPAKTETAAKSDTSTPKKESSS